MRISRFAPAMLLLGTLIWPGCGAATDEKANARNQTEYDIWSSNVAAHLSLDDVRVFQQAQQEIRLYIMGHTSASGSEAIGNAFLLKVDGLTVKQLMVLGLQDRIKRLTDQRNEAKTLYDQNSAIKTNGGDETSANYLAGRVAEDRQRLDKSNADLAATQADLDRISK
jgi:hypothetical protein